MSNYLNVLFGIDRKAFFCIAACVLPVVLLFVGCGGDDNPAGSDHTHNWGDWIVTTPAACTAPGVETRTCAEDANHTETRVVAQLSGAQCGGGGQFNPDINYGYFTDTRNSQTYRTVVIGTQTWMAQNLNYQPSSGNSWCYGNSEDNCIKYGRLYDWNTAMGGSPSSGLNPSGLQGVCPDDWHLPSRAEWDQLMTFVGGGSTAGRKLKSKSGGWYGDGNGTDDYGFSALPGGYRNNSGNFSNAVFSGYWWSATENGDNNARNRVMGHGDDQLKDDYDYKSYGHSVRCVQD